MTTVPSARSADQKGSGPPTPHVHTLRDGTAVLIRPLDPADRDELVERYRTLSPRSRRLRFVSAPSHLSPALLDHLLDVDFVDRYAVVATLVDEPGSPSVGVARFFRSGEEPTHADAAVTVVDEHQGRGIGTLLLTELVRAAIGGGIDCFTADVLWENHDLLASLRAVGAVVVPGEPGLASVRVAIPSTLEELRRSPVYEVMRMAGTHVFEAPATPDERPSDG